MTRYKSQGKKLCCNRDSPRIMLMMLWGFPDTTAMVVNQQQGTAGNNGNFETFSVALYT